MRPAWALVAIGLASVAVSSSTKSAELEPHAQSEDCQRLTFENSRFEVCSYVAGVDEIRLDLRGPSGVLGSLPALRQALGGDAARVKFAMNAGMYAADQTPMGLFVQDGKKLHPLNLHGGGGNFFLKPNGVFWIDAAGTPHIDDSVSFGERHVEPAMATQSGPLLVQSGQLHPQVAPDGPSINIRNGVCVRQGRAYFAISDDAVSFGRFARLLRDRVGCPDALYLDGAISSFWSPALGRIDKREGLGPLVVVLRASGRK